MSRDEHGENRKDADWGRHLKRVKKKETLLHPETWKRKRERKHRMKLRGKKS